RVRSCTHPDAHAASGRVSALRPPLIGAGMERSSSPHERSDMRGPTTENPGYRFAHPGYEAKKRSSTEAANGNRYIKIPAIGKSDGASTNTFLTQGSRGVHMDAARTGRAVRDARKRGEFGRFRQW